MPSDNVPLNLQKVQPIRYWRTEQGNIINKTWTAQTVGGGSWEIRGVETWRRSQRRGRRDLQNKVLGLGSDTSYSNRLLEL